MNSSGWTRTREVIDLLEPALQCSQPVMEGRIRSALQVGAFRCQARFVDLQVSGKPVSVKLPWTIPQWLWKIPSGRIRLVLDSFSVSVGPYDLEGIDLPEDYLGFERAHLQGLRFHPAEFRDFFQLQPLPEKPKPKKRKTTVSKAAAIKECVAWLDREFGKDPEFKKRRGDFEDSALRHFVGRLSGRGFERAWRQATNKHPERSAGGRPKGT